VTQELRPAPAAEATAAERLRTGLAASAVGLAIAAAVLVYPRVLDSALDRFGVRAVSALLLALLALTLRFRSRAPRSGPVAAVGLAALLLGAAISDERRVLRLVPAWVYVGLAWTFLGSLRGPQSIVERGARWIVPEAPPFIDGYCRVVTAGWALCFAVIAAVVIWLGAAGPPEAWRAFTGRDVWIAMAVLMLLEFFVRKTWFRAYFRGGPFERFWSRLFPAERTARGRRSQEYIRRYRQRMSEAETRPEDRGRTTSSRS
jgi:uncharacterized membrane protein